MFSGKALAFVSLRRLLLAAVALPAVALPVVGCSIGSITPPSTSAAGLSGIAHGGPNPVIGATVNLYATTSGGYGAAATLLGTATTNSQGFFNFVNAGTCTANQQAYITAYGGNPGSGTNPNYLLMAALGPCANISPATSIWIDEVTTVAAAYSLRPFTFITANSGIPTVQVGAPASNNVVTGLCTTANSVTTSCQAAGLTHAFSNALNLANSVSLPGSLPNGQAYQVTPSNPNGVVPTALINSLADSVEACVNSPGGTSGDGSPCGNLFAYTTPPVTGASAPTNTLQALLNVAQYPALTAANVTNLYNLATPISFYYPALTSAPADFSLAIAYSGVTLGSQAGSVTALTLTNPNASGFGSGVGYTAVPAVTIAAPASGTTATATASLGLVYFNVTGGACAAGTDNVTIAGGGGTGAAANVTFDSTGTVILSSTVTASGSGYTSLPTFTVANCTTQPAAAQKQKGLGVVSIAITNGGTGYTSAPAVTIAAPTGTAPPTPATATATASVGGATPFAAPYAIALDSNDDVFVGSQNALGAAGAYSFASSIASNGASLFTTTQTTTLTAPRGAATDTLGHLWLAQNNTPVIQGLSSVNGAAFTTLTTGAAPFGLAVDKSNNVWYGIASTTAQNLFELQQSAATPYTSVTFTTPPLFTNPVRSIAFDANQNAYVSGFNATTNTAGSFPNTGSVPTPAYASAAINTALTGASGPGIALDAQSNLWAPTTAGLFKVMPTFGGTNGITVTALTPGTAFTDNVATPNYNSVDGAGNIWVPNNTTGTQAIVQYVQSTGAAASYSPCYAAAGATTCAAALSQPQRTVIDSTGSVWITSLSNGRIYQLLGTGAPTWPQLSLGAPGVSPP